MKQAKMAYSFLQTSALPLGYRALAQSIGKEWVLRFVEKGLTSNFVAPRDTPLAA